MNAFFLFGLLSFFLPFALAFDAGVPSDPEFGKPTGVTLLSNDLSFDARLLVECAGTPTLSGGDGSNFGRVGVLIREEVLAPAAEVSSRDVPVDRGVPSTTASEQVTIALITGAPGKVYRWTAACVYKESSSGFEIRGSYSDTAFSSARAMTITSGPLPSSISTSGGVVTLTGSGFATEAAFDAANPSLRPLLVIGEPPRDVLVADSVTGGTVVFTVPAQPSGTAVTGLRSGSLTMPASPLVVAVGPPLVFDMFPTQGSADGGGKVQMVGENLSPNAGIECVFGTSLVTAVVVNSTLLECTVPAPGAQTVAASVLASGTAIVAPAVSLSYMYVAAVSIVRVTPTVLPQQSTVPITVSGTGFPTTGSMRCSFESTTYVATTTAATRVDALTVTCPVSLTRKSTAATAVGPGVVDVRVSVDETLTTFTKTSLPLTVFEEVKVASVSPQSVAVGDVTTTTLKLLFSSGLLLPPGAAAECFFDTGSGPPTRTSMFVGLDDGGKSATCAMPSLGAGQSAEVSYTLNDGVTVASPAAGARTIVTVFDPSTGSVVVAGVDPPAVPSGPAAGQSDNQGTYEVRPFGVGLDAEGGNSLAGLGTCTFVGGNGSAAAAVVPLTKSRVVTQSLACVVPQSLRLNPGAAPSSGLLPVLSLTISAGQVGGNGSVTYPIQVYPPPTGLSLTPSTVSANTTAITVTGTGLVELFSRGATLAECRFGSTIAPVPATITVTSGTIGLGSTGSAAVKTGVITCPAPTTTPQQVQLSVSLNGDDAYPVGGVTFLGCPAGTASPSSDIACTPCGAGTYAADGATSCAPCDRGFYAPGQRQTECFRCPNNTITATGGAGATSGAASVTECICLGGYFSRGGTSGVECEPCLEGADCTDPLGIPVPRAGYWSRSDQPYLVYKCTPEQACPGGATDACKEGHTGLVCGECGPDYYKADGICRQCDKEAPIILAAFVVFMVLVAVVFVIKAGKNAAGFFSTISIIASYFQVVSVSGTFDLKWPRSVQTATYIMSIPFTVNLDFLESECTLPWSYRGKMITTLGIPVIFLVIFAVMYFFVFMRKKTVDVIADPITRRWPRFVAAPSVPVTRAAKFRYSIAMFLTQKWTRDDLKRSMNFMINGFTMILTLSYLFLSYKSLELFQCTEQPAAGVWTLDADPSVLCYGDAWWSMFPFSVLGIVVYAIGIPLMFRIVFAARIYDDGDFMQRFSALFERYQRDHANWESYILMRKLGIVVAKVLLNDTGVFQPTFALIVLFVALQIQSSQRPYNARRFNALEGTLLWCSCITLFCGIVFLSGGLSGTAELAMTIGIFVVLAVSALAIVWAVVLELRFHISCVRASGRLPADVSRVANKDSLPRLAEWWDGPGERYREALTSLCRQLVICDKKGRVFDLQRMESKPGGLLPTAEAVAAAAAANAAAKDRNGNGDGDDVDDDIDISDESLDGLERGDRANANPSAGAGASANNNDRISGSNGGVHANTASVSKGGAFLYDGAHSSNQNQVAKYYLSIAAATLVRPYFMPYLVSVFVALEHKDRRDGLIGQGGRLETKSRALRLAMMLRAWSHYSVHRDREDREAEESRRLTRLLRVATCAQTYARVSTIEEDYATTAIDGDVCRVLFGDVVTGGMLTYMAHSFAEMYTASALGDYARLSLSLARPGVVGDAIGGGNDATTSDNHALDKKDLEVSSEEDGDSESSEDPPQQQQQPGVRGVAQLPPLTALPRLEDEHDDDHHHLNDATT